MSLNLGWTKFSHYLRVELQQSADEGADILSFIPEADEIAALPEGDNKEKRAQTLLDEITLLHPANNGYTEPSDLAEIRGARPDYGKGANMGAPNIAEDRLRDKMHGAWLGRCCGCLLGVPMEGKKVGNIEGFLKDTDNYPPSRFITSDIPREIKEKYNLREGRQSIDKITCMPPDDDTNYTIIALKLMEEKGVAFTPDDVAVRWIQDLPFWQVCTAERLAFRNFVNGKSPPESATLYNPYREWIGAQIRADLFGYVTPGNPELGAEFAWRDASISHVRNGIYGAMFVAAMLSHAAVCGDMNEVIKAGLGQIPKNSRLYQKITAVVGAYHAGESFDAALKRLYADYNDTDEHMWIHTIPNAVIVTNALLHGGGDFERTVGLALIQGMDTDCNCATAGSIAGMALGAAALPAKWTAPLNDTLLSGVDGFNRSSIADLASRTYDVYAAKVKPIL